MGSKEYLDWERDRMIIQKQLRQFGFLETPEETIKRLQLRIKILEEELKKYERRDLSND